jgi:acyl-CoA thioesterase
VSTFDDETAVESIGMDEIGRDRWSARVDGRWNIGDNPNGGYLVSIALAALARVSAHPDPVSVTTHFLRPGTGNEAAEVTTEILRSGRTITTARATLSQSGTTRIEIVAAFAELAPTSRASNARERGGAGRGSDAIPSFGPPPPIIPPPDRCVVRSGSEQGIQLPILDRLDVMIHPDQARAGQAGTPVVSGWIRLADGTDPSPRSLLMFADAFPPSLFGSLGSVGWVPTIELTAHIRRRPSPGWILGQLTTSDLDDGRMIEDGLLWDETGALVAQSRQMGLVLAR